MEREPPLTREAQDFSFYRFHLELVMKVAAFTFGVTGAMVSYYLKNAGAPGLLKYSLLLPLLMNAGFATACVLSTPSAARLRKVNKVYELVALPVLLWLFAALFALVTAGLVVLLVVGGDSS